MRRKSGKHWVEYRDPIDLMDCPSNMDIGLSKKEPTINGLMMLQII